MDRLEGCRKVGMGAYSTPFRFMLLLLYEVYGLQLTKSEKGKKGGSLQEIETSARKCGCKKKHLSTTLTGMYSNIYDWI